MHILLKRRLVFSGLKVTDVTKSDEVHDNLHEDISTCRGLCVTYRWVVDLMIEFIDTLYIQLGTTSNYRAIADPHTLQFTVTHALGFSDFTSRILATDFITALIPVSL
jgi:hypothetical protein